MTGHIVAKRPDSAAELGSLIDHLAGRIQAGEMLDLEAVISAHPDRANELRELFPTLQLLADVASSGGTLRAGGGLVGALGDFRIAREVGRGGMGIVYEAQQISLDRRVALKVLPFAATMDPKQLQRFKNEARAAASLHHEHIVPVYGVGCERGVHFYAMQFIEGKSLGVLVRQLRGRPASSGVGAAECQEPESSLRRLQARDSNEPVAPSVARDATASFVAESYVESVIAPAATETVAALCTQLSRDDRARYRSIAEMIAQAADALEHAHSLGIVHRDVKPGNLILDNAGHLWVTDFGLARFGNDADLTMTGDLVGTLRYMSPEQALAKHGLVDHRTDVYSLGATLYELLTLRPAMDGDDKQEVLRKIAFEEPRTPRMVDRAIPAELETITLKALAKEPAERYATAGAFAEDLRRWLSDQTIKAKPPTLRLRLVKWGRRHPSLVAATGVVFLLVVVGLAISNVFIGRARLDAVNAATVADTRRAEADQAVNDMYVEVAEEWLRDQPALEEVQRKFAEKALTYYERRVREERDNPNLRAAVATSLYRMAVIHDRLGDLSKGADAYTQAADIFGRLAAENPENREYRYWQAHSLAERGDLCDRVGNGKAAEDLARQAYDLFQQAAGRFPDDILIRAGLSDCCLVLGSVNFSPGLWIKVFRPDYSARRWKECDRLLRQALKLYPSVIASEPNRSDHRWRFHRTQKLLSQMPNVSSLPFAEREQLANDSVAGFESLVKAFPRQQRSRVELCEALVWRGEVSEAAGRPAEAETANRRALEIADKLVEEYPKVPNYRMLQASTRYTLGLLLVSIDRLADAEPLLTQAAKTLQDTPEGLAPPFQLWKEAARCYRRLGIVFEQVGRLDEAETAQRQALRIDRQIARDNPNSSSWMRLGYDTGRLAAMLTRRGSPLDGINVHRAHTEFWKELADRQPGNSLARLAHEWSLIGLGRVLRDSGLLLQRSDLLTQADQAFGESQKVGARLEEGGRLDPAPEEEWVIAYRDCWKWAQIYRSWLYEKTGRLDEAEKARRQILRHTRQVEAASPGKPAPGREVANAIWDLARFLDQALRRRSASITAYGEAINEFNRLAREFPGDLQYAVEAAGARMELAFVHQLGGNADEANRVADEAVTFLRGLPTNDRWDRRILAVPLADLAIIRWRAGRVEDAATAIREAVAITDNLLADQALQSPLRIAVEGSMAIVTARQAYLFERAGQFAEAEAAYDKAATLHRRLAEAVVPGEWFDREGPRTSAAGGMNEYIRTRSNLAGSLVELALFHLRRGRVDQAASHCAEGRAVFERMVDAYPADQAALNELAWFLVTCPVKDLRDPARAARLARKAAAPDIEIDLYVSTLGAAQYRSGDYRAAADNLNLARRLRDLPLKADELFFLAMAHYRLGETEAARRDYDEGLRALEWLDIHPSYRRQQLREEAAAVLAVK
jgi:serine/threonine protein kinase